MAGFAVVGGRLRTERGPVCTQLIRCVHSRNRNSSVKQLYSNKKRYLIKKPVDLGREIQNLLKPEKGKNVSTNMENIKDEMCWDNVSWRTDGCWREMIK